MGHKNSQIIALNKKESEAKTDIGRETAMGSEMNRKVSQPDLLPLKGVHNFGRNATFVSIKLKSPPKEGTEGEEA
jgi:hypothetical protein